jgi:hypothetical protein
MNRLELGKYWITRLCRALPGASVRMTTRMAWHLAALSVHSDEEFSILPDAALAQFAGGSRHFLGLREQYFRSQARQALLVPDAPSLSRGRVAGR